MQGIADSKMKARNNNCTKGKSLATRVGPVLLELNKTVKKAEKCRRTLAKLGFSNSRWQEIVNDVDPEFRFLVRPKVLDAILVYLHSKRQPVSRESLVEHLSSHSVGSIQRIRQSITTNLHNGKLILCNGNDIALAEWKASGRLSSSISQRRAENKRKT
jgi:hypothetical protein